MVMNCLFFGMEQSRNDHCSKYMKYYLNHDCQKWINFYHYNIRHLLIYLNLFHYLQTNILFFLLITNLYYLHYLLLIDYNMLLHLLHFRYTYILHMLEHYMLLLGYMLYINQKNPSVLM